MPTENELARTFIVLSPKRTHRRYKAITLWRSDDSGYCWKLDSAQAIHIIADHGRGFF